MRIMVKHCTTIAHLSLSMQRQIVICKAILSTRLLQQRYSMLSSIAAPEPHKGKEEAENMNAHHGQSLYEQLPARSLISRFHCKSRLWYAKQYCLNDFLNNAFPRHLRLLPWCHTKWIKKKLKTLTHVMVKYCTTKLPAPSLISRFQCKNRFWYAKQYRPLDFIL